MTLAAGSKLGPYEILGQIGAGGMGEVYRARDPRLGRDVAIKVLPESFSADVDRLRRFEREARAAGILNHPNITIVYDIGSHEAAPYVVQELLEGETLRAELAGGPLPQRKAIEYALQIACGLSAAHEKGIVHRDLKPENLFVTRDGRVKILDFGLAKLTHDTTQSDVTTETAVSEPGAVLGTVGYMSPEQVRGQRTDARGDLFAFGSVLYEMLSGKRAFSGASSADTMAAVLYDDPPDLLEDNPGVPPLLDRIVRHCLEKSRERRFQSARDLVFDLEGLPSLAGQHQPRTTGPSSSRWTRDQSTYRRLTFRRGTIPTARFSPDEQTIVCCARWEGARLETFAIRRESPESRSLGLPETRLLAVSSSAEMAVALDFERAVGHPSGGTLARVPLGGGAPRELLGGVKWADWLPDGSSLAVVRTVGGRDRLDFPIGTPVYEPAGWIAFLRVSPGGDLVAFMDYPGGGTTGSVAIVSREGRVERLSGIWADTRGLAWSPGGEEVWFTASNTGSARALRAVTLEGRERLVEQVPGGLFLHDISPSGSVLLNSDVTRSGILCRIANEPEERELSWFDYSAGPVLSADGHSVLFSEGGEGGGPLVSTYLRRTDGSPAVRLGDGEALGLSTDGEWVLSRSISLNSLHLIPTGAGPKREIVHEGFTYRHNVAWFPEGGRFLFAASERGRPPRSYIQDLDRSTTNPVTPEGTIAYAISHDGRYVAAGNPALKLYPLEGGDPLPIAGSLPGDAVIGWHLDGRSLFVRSGYLPARVFRIDLATGHREPFLELMPSDPAGINAIDSVTLTPDARAYAYSYMWMRSDLYVAEGLV